MASTTNSDDGSTSGGSDSPAMDFLTSPIGLAFVGGVIVALAIGYVIL